MVQFSTAGSALLRALEGLRLQAYDDATGRPPADGERVIGRLTIGYGHTGRDVLPGMIWSATQAEYQLSDDVDAVANQVIGMVKADLSDNQFSALVCLAFNIGTNAFAGSSALRLANEGILQDVPAHIRLWDKVEIGGVPRTSPGLVGRRAAEVALWDLPGDLPPPNFAAIRDAAVAALKGPGDA